MIIEAEWLWAAESKSEKPTGKISARWGCATMATNPTREIPQEFFEGWSKRVSRETGYAQLTRACDEAPIVNAAGILNIAWPSKLNGGVLDLDILLATATNPTTDADGHYPIAEKIADAWKSENGRCYANYFWCNRKHKITTFQDADIERHLSNNDSNTQEQRSSGLPKPL